MDVFGDDETSQYGTTKDIIHYPHFHFIEHISLIGMPTSSPPPNTMAPSESSKNALKNNSMTQTYINWY